jgi:predicted Na+-dependent transporter
MESVPDQGHHAVLLSRTSSSTSTTVLGVAPTPFFIVAFATMENLDVRLTVNIVSVSMLMSLPLALGQRTCAKRQIYLWQKMFR